jgi:hypothetical protein
MTDGQKVKHAIEVLGVIHQRIAYDEADNLTILTNLEDLGALLEKPHVPDSKAPKETSQAAKNLCSQLFRHITSRKQNFRTPNLRQWEADMDKILRLDCRDEEALAEVIDWCQQDDFWKDNILSPAKLRKQLDKLELRMAKDFNWKRRRSLTQSNGPTAREKYMESLKDEANTGVDG